MYNGIGLQTARGSGTSGYVQKNLSTIRSTHKKHDFPTEEDIQRMEAALNKPPNQELLTHQKKRQIELKCLEERERLESQGYDEEAIEKRLVDYRQELKIKAEEIAKIKEPTPKSELFKSASSTRNRYSPKRDRRRSTSRDRSPPPAQQTNSQPVTTTTTIVKASPTPDTPPPQPAPKTHSSPKYSIVPSKLRRVSSSESPSPPRERRRSRSREKKPSKKVRRVESPKRRRSTSRSRRSRSRERKTKSHHKSSKSRKHKSRSKDSRSKSQSSRSRSRSRSSHSRSRSRDSPPRSRRSRSNSRTRKRKVSPSFRESRRITSARKRPTPYQRDTSSSSSGSESEFPLRYRLNGSSSKHWSGKSSPDSSIDSM